MSLVNRLITYRRAVLLAVVILALFTLPTIQHSQTNNPQPNATKMTAVLAELARVIPQDVSPASLTAVHPAMRLAKESLPKAVRDAIQTRMMRVNANGEVQVYVLVNEVNAVNLAQLKSMGVTIEISDPDGRRVQARIPVSRLQSVSSLPFVTFVRLPNYAVRMTGTVNTEGDTILQADQARAQLNVDGTGVLVAAISDGLKGIFAPCPAGQTSCSVGGVANGPISTNDLPAATGTRTAEVINGTTYSILTASSGGIAGQTFDSTYNDLEGTPRDNNGNPLTCGFAGAGAEGTALLEIIHDIAPGATLSFANANTDLEFNQAVNTLSASNDVVMDDLGFFGLPQDGTSTVSANTAAALNSTSNLIRGYYTAAGNLSDSHYYGTFTDSQQDGFTRTGQHGDMHLFQANSTTADTLSLGPQTYNEISLQGTTTTNASTGGEVFVILSWDDPFGSSSNTYNVYLVQHGTNTVVASDVGKQCEGGANPVACFSYVNNGSADANYDIVIQNPNNASAAKNLNLFAFTPECAFGGLKSLSPSRAKINFNTPGRSIIAESDSGGSPNTVVSVAAICSATAAAQAASTTKITNYPDPSCQDTTNSTAEYFSSQGPTLDGRNKPDISGIDGVSITGAGGFENPFFGTSAATPHIAGIAALLLESKVCLLTNVPGSQSFDDVTARTELHDLLLDNADPLGPMAVFGAGRANALASGLQTVPMFSGSTSIVVGGNTPSGVSLGPNDLGFAAPLTCPDALLNWTGGCGTSSAGSTRMNCPFGTNTVTVSSSNSLDPAKAVFSAPASIQIVVTSFDLTTSPGSATVPAGQSATYTVSATATGGAFNNAVTLACSNVPAASSCSFNPASVTPGPGGLSVPSTLTIRTTARSSAPPADWFSPNGWKLPAPLENLPLGILLFVLTTTMAIASLPALKRRVLPRFAPGLPSIAILFVLCVLLLTQLSCGGGNNTPPPPSGTPAGTYTINISGTSGTLVQSNTATLVVQ